MQIRATNTQQTKKKKRVKKFVAAAAYSEQTAHHAMTGGLTKKKMYPLPVLRDTDSGKMIYWLINRLAG